MTRHAPSLTTDDHVRGAPHAPLVIIQYGDYDCPHTRASAPIIGAILEELPVQSRFVFRHFPLRHLHANAQILSEVAEAAGAVGSFWNVHDRLMGHRRGITQDDVFVDLRAAGVDVDAVQRPLGSTSIRERIERDVHSGVASGVHSTPTWFFNGHLWEGHYDRETLLAEVHRALEGTA